MLIADNAPHLHRQPMPKVRFKYQAYAYTSPEIPSN
jgi:hypothetical protein